MTQTLIDPGPTGPQFLFFSVAGFLLLFLYFFPTTLSLLSRRPSPAAMLTNLCLGWTGIGWLGAIFLAANHARGELLAQGVPASRREPAPSSDAADLARSSATSDPTETPTTDVCIEPWNEDRWIAVWRETHWVRKTA